MANVNELAADIRAGQTAFLEAMGAATGQWNAEVLLPEVAERTVPALRRPWTPAYACFHVVSSYWALADMALDHVARARRGDPPPMRDQYTASWWATQRLALDELRANLREPATASEVTRERLEVVNHSLDEITDRDLDAPWDPGEFNAVYMRSLGVAEVPQTVASLLTMMGLHLHDHAAQVRDGCR